MPAIIVALFCLLIGLLPADMAGELAYRRTAIAAGEWWRLWSCHLVHYNWPHLLVDSGMLAGLGWLLRRRLPSWLLAVAMLVVMPLIAAVLYFWLPLLVEYRGASGLAMMLWVLLGLQLLREQPWVGGGLLLLLVARTAADILGLGELFTTLPTDTEIAWQAHLVGAVAGLLLFLLVLRIGHNGEERG